MSASHLLTVLITIKVGTWVDWEVAQLKKRQRMKVGDGRGVPIEACRFFFFSAAFLGLPRRVIHFWNSPKHSTIPFIFCIFFFGVELLSL